MRHTRLGLFIVLTVMVAESRPLFGQRQGNPNAPTGRQGDGSPETGSRGRGGASDNGRAGGGRGRAPALRTGTAAIRGRVFADGTNTPVRRATIQASFVGEATGRSEPPRTVASDENGIFEFHDLPAGRWTVRASKIGFIEQQYGQRSAFAETDPIVLADGQQLVADFRLSRGGAITGRVFDEFGDPAAGVRVNVSRVRATGQGPQLSRAGTSVPTDDTGAYRVYGLAPGRYYVSANDPSSRLVAGSAANFVLARPAEEGGRGAASYAPTYYPGTPVMTQAQPVTLALGEEQSGINISIIPVRAARITGKVVSASGAPLKATVTLSSSLGQSIVPAGGRNGTGADGSFAITNVSPGDYTLNVLGPNIGSAPPEVAAMPVSVNGQDILDLTIVAGRGASIDGTVLSDNGARLPTTRMRITAVPMQNSIATYTAGAETSANGDFRLESLLGVYTLRIDSLPAGWIVKSITANGIDISDSRVELGAGDRISVRVELTDRIALVTGAVRSDKPIPGATVIIFSDEPARWTSNSRFIRSTRITGEGRFTVTGLPPHPRYLALALDYLEPGETQNTEFLQRAKLLAVPFSLAPGEQKFVDLSLVVR